MCVCITFIQLNAYTHETNWSTLDHVAKRIIQGKMRHQICLKHTRSLSHTHTNSATFDLVIESRFENHIIRKDTKWGTYTYIHTYIHTHTHIRTNSAAFDLVTEKEFEYDINFIRENLKWGPAPSLPLDAPIFVPGGPPTATPGGPSAQAPAQQQVHIYV